MPTRIAFDSETWLFTPGLLIPPGVCGSFYDGTQAPWVELYADAVETLAGCLRPGTQIEGAKIDFDMAVVCREQPNLIPEIFSHYDRGGFFDVQIAQALDAVSRGLLFKDPGGGPLRQAPKPDGTPGKVTKRYSLETVKWLVLGQNDAKANAEFRLRYGELSALPFDQWPEKARVYPGDDARNPYDIATVQRATHQNLGPLLRVKPNEAPETWEPITVEWYEKPGVSRVRTTLTHMSLNTYAAFGLHLMSAWGLRVDPVALKALRTRCERIQQEEIGKFQGAGLLKSDGKTDGAAVKARVIRAYRDPFEVDSPCSDCAGSGKVPSPKTKNKINCKTCGATGLKVGPEVPNTPTGGISGDRDTLMNSGDELLSDFGQSTNAKILETYLPFLEQGLAAPINVSANVLLATGRVSFGKGDDDGQDSESAGLLQTFPRKGGVRECVISPPGWVMCSDDWNALEFANLGQAQKNVMGYSPIVESINSGKDPHSILGAKMLDISYDEFRAKLKAPETKDAFKDLRFGTKAGNFGFGGRMGPGKFTYTQRRQRIGGHGSMCKLMSREQVPCGSVTINSWKRRPIPRVCETCCQVSEELRLSWLELWELKDFFAYVDAIEGVQDGSGVMITPGTGYMRGGLNVSAACNQPFQHLGAYGAKLALAAVQRECYVDRGTALFGCRPIIMSHDEIITLMPESYAHEASLRQTELMKWAMKQICPDVDIGIEPALMRRWYKDAEAHWVDPKCTSCSEGWIFGSFDGKRTRTQCEQCKQQGRLTAWEPLE